MNAESDSVEGVGERTCVRTGDKLQATPTLGSEKWLEPAQPPLAVRSSPHLDASIIYHEYCKSALHASFCLRAWPAAAI